MTRPALVSKCTLNGAGSGSGSWLIDRRSSAEAPHLLLRAALEYCAAGGAKVATVMRHAGADTLNVRDILVAEPHRVWFASRALLRGPLLRSGGQRRACERETEKRKGRDWSQIHAARIPTLVFRWCVPPQYYCQFDRRGNSSGSQTTDDLRGAE